MSESKRRLILGLQDALGATVTTALHDPDVVEVMLNPDGNLFIERVGQGIAAAGRMDPATEKVNNWFRNNSPFDRARTMTVSIEVNNVVALSNQSYQVDWSEIERDRAGKELRTRRFRGIATVSRLRSRNCMPASI